MGFQEIIVGILFLLAIAYFGRMIYHMFRPKPNSGCGAGCKCGVDFSKELSK